MAKGFMKLISDTFAVMSQIQAAQSMYTTYIMSMLLLSLCYKTDPRQTGSTVMMKERKMHSVDPVSYKKEV